MPITLVSRQVLKKRRRESVRMRTSLVTSRVVGDQDPRGSTSVGELQVS